MMLLRRNRSVGQRFDRGFGPPVRTHRQTRISRSLYSVDYLLACTKDVGKEKKIITFSTAAQKNADQAARVNLLARDQRQINTNTSDWTAIIITPRSIEKLISLVPTLLFIYYHEYIIYRYPTSLTPILLSLFNYCSMVTIKIWAIIIARIHFILLSIFFRF